MSALISRGGVVGQGLEYLRDRPIFVFAVLVIVLVVSLVASAGPSPDAAGEAAKWIIGVAALALVLFTVLAVIDKPQRKRSLDLAKVTRVENLPQIPDDVSDDLDDLAAVMLTYLKQYFDQAQVVVDAGAESGVKRGDYFVVVRRPERAAKLGIEQISLLQAESDSMLEVVSAFPQYSICRLAAFAYQRYDQHLAQALPRLVNADGLLDLDNLAEALSPIEKGQTLLRIPPSEKLHRDVIEDHYNRTLDAALPDPDRRFQYEEMIRAADRFLREHPNGFFAPDALFQKGFAQLRLGDPRAAAATYEHFVDQYPFHDSARGAREHIEEARQTLAQNMSQQAD